MKFLTKTLASLTLALTFTLTLAQAGANVRPNGHAPLSVMGDHTHDRGEWMLSYRYMNMQMDGMRNGTDRVRSAAVLAADGDDQFTTRSEGFGDTKVSALYRFCSEANRQAQFGLGLSLPTGSISENDRTPRPGMPPSFNRNQLPASMQLGSGTFDLLPSVTFLQQFPDWSWGAQANGVQRLESENSNGYRLGHQFEGLAWLGYNLTD